MPPSRSSQFRSVRMLTTMTMTMTLATTLLLAQQRSSVAAHGMHGMHGEAADAVSDDYKCPVCRMSTADSGYDNKNWVELNHGQRVYTCGMAPRQMDDYTFESTDTAYLGANMAEFILFHSADADEEEEYVCDDTSCPECADGISDPVSGEPISVDAFYVVCLVNGQKIYFGSAETRTEYLSSVGSKPRVLVEAMTCAGESCSDATTITTLSKAAKAFKPQEDGGAPVGGGSGASGTTPKPNTPPSSDKTETKTNENDEDDDLFCSGEGSVMFNGFTSTVNGSCVMLFFHPWVLNSALKYVFGFFGCMALAIANEYLVKFREATRLKLIESRQRHALNKSHKWGCKLLLAVLYMIQMSVAYFAMLVVMIYETGLFIALILGFGAGFLLFKDFDKDVTSERGSWRFTDPTTQVLHVEGMSCMQNCGMTVERALTAVEGVTRACVDFDAKQAFVAGTAPQEALVQAVQAVGFEARPDSTHTSNASMSSGYVPPPTV